MRTQFPYAIITVPGGRVIKRPNIEVVLSFNPARPNARNTPRIEMLIDTGADSCMFAWSWANWMGFDPQAVGKRDDVRGIGGNLTEAYVVHGIEMSVPDLEFKTQLDAHFLPMPKRICGVLGHKGFLDHLNIRFFKGQYFEVIDDRPAPVVQLGDASRQKNPPNSDTTR